MHSLQHVSCLSDFTKAQLVGPETGHFMAGYVGSSDKLDLLFDPARPDTKHLRDSNAPALADGAGGSLID